MRLMIIQILKRWELIASGVMISFGAWNVKRLNKTRKQLEVARFISYHNLSLVGLLETKVKRKELRALYLRMFPSWCLTSNLAWHEGGRIIVGWNSVDVHVDILRCQSQYIHLVVSPVRGTQFVCTLSMVQMIGMSVYSCFLTLGS